MTGSTPDPTPVAATDPEDGTGAGGAAIEKSAGAPAGAGEGAAGGSAAAAGAGEGAAGDDAAAGDGEGVVAAAAGAGGGRRLRRRRDRGVAVLAGGGVVLLLVAGGVGMRAAAGAGGGSGEPPLSGGRPTQVTAPAAPATPTAVAGVATSRPDGSWGPVSNQSPVAAPAARPAAGVRPVGLRIPAIGVDASSLVPLAIIPATGELAAPTQFDQTGWYAAGPVPGEPGPAVIAAHVDSRAGPAVFFRLKELKAGDKVYVPRSDGTTAAFAVTAVERYPKNAFPTQRVHGPTPDRALRLITCGGSFDYAKRSYRDNVVVYAVRTG